MNNFLLWFLRIWIVLVVLLNLMGILGTYTSSESFLTFTLWFQETYSPFNIGNWGLNFLLLSPAIAVYFWRKKRLKKSSLYNTYPPTLWKNSSMLNTSEELAKTLDELLALMELDDDDSNWYHWMLDARRQLDESSIGGASRLKDAYGGMGSFNDHAPHKVELDDEFNKLRSEAYCLATEIIVADRRGGK